MIAAALLLIIGGVAAMQLTRTSRGFVLSGAAFAAGLVLVGVHFALHQSGV